MKCKYCLKSVNTGFYGPLFQLSVIEDRQMNPEQGHVFTVDAGVFCSAKCLSEYLNGTPPNK